MKMSLTRKANKVFPPGPPLFVFINLRRKSRDERRGCSFERCHGTCTWIRIEVKNENLKLCCAVKLKKGLLSHNLMTHIVTTHKSAKISCGSIGD